MHGLVVAIVFLDDTYNVYCLFYVRRRAALCITTQLSTFRTLSLLLPSSQEHLLHLQEWFLFRLLHFDYLPVFCFVWHCCASQVLYSPLSTFEAFTTTPHWISWSGQSHQERSFLRSLWYVVDKCEQRYAWSVYVFYELFSDISCECGSLDWPTWLPHQTQSTEWDVKTRGSKREVGCTSRRGRK